MSATKLTAELLSERNQIASKASGLESMARRLRSRLEQLDEVIEAELVKSKKSSIKRCGGWLLAWVNGQAKVSWKDEFIRIAGVEAADKLAKEAKPKLKLKVTPPDQ